MGLGDSSTQVIQLSETGRRAAFHLGVPNGLEKETKLAGHIRLFEN